MSGRSYADEGAIREHIEAGAEDAGLFAHRSETEVLAAALTYPEAVDDFLEKLTPEMFGDGLHGKTWAEIAERRRSGRHVSLELITEVLAREPDFVARGGERWLRQLTGAPSMFGFEEHVEIIADRAGRRAVNRTLLDVRALLGKGAPAAELLDALDREVTRLRDEDAPSQDNLIDAHTSVGHTLAELDDEARHGRPKGAMTGLRCFDRRMRGLRPGWLIILAGRPSMGKTALARAAALGAARKNPEKATLFFALEMQRRELDERTLSQLSYERFDSMNAIAYKDMAGDKLPPEDLSLLHQCGSDVPRNLLIDDTATLTVEYVRRRALAVKRRQPIAAIFIDYLQIMQRPQTKGRNDAAIIGDMTAALKRLARELGCAVVLLSQLSRNVESREDKRPLLSDLRDSGAIEQDANAVLFTYREVYYTERAEPKDDASQAVKTAWQEKVELQRRDMDVICAKVRQASIGRDRQRYLPEYDVIEDCAQPTDWRAA